MMNPAEPFLILLLGHLIGDFVFQTEQMALRKVHVMSWLLLHAIQLAMITWLLCWDLQVWPVVFAVFATHMIFDWCKPRMKGDPLTWYLADQAGHIIVLWWGANWIVKHLSYECMPLTAWVPLEMQAIVAAYILAGRPITVALALFLKPWQTEILKQPDQPNDCPVTGLARSGEWIGNLERFMVVTCVLCGQFVVIGGLLIAKALMRNGELSRSWQRKQTDYVIIGTFGSVALAIVIGLLARLYFQPTPGFLRFPPIPGIM